MVSLIVNRDEGRGVNNSILEGLHRGSVFFVPCKGLVFASEVVKWVSNGLVVLDPNTHISHDTKESVDIGDVLAWWPVADFGYF